MNRQSGGNDGSRGKILVTGGAGYVGSHIVKRLSDAGYSPIIFDNFSSGSSSISRWGLVERGDLRDRDRLQSVMASHRPLVVIHAATSSSIAAASLPSPKAAYDGLVLGTLNLVEAMRDHHISMLCLMSGASVYGEASALFVSEQTSVRPLAPYGACLAAIETMVSDFSMVGDLRWASLRLFTSAGAEPDHELGEALTEQQHLIPSAIDAMLGHRPFVPVHGSHFDTRDGTALRDYVHVSDIADATLRALEGLFSGRAAGPYNIGSGVEHSVLEVVQAVESVSGQKCPIRYEAKKLDEPPVISADPSRAANELLWKPVHSSLDFIVTSALAFRKLRWQEREEAGLLGEKSASSAGSPGADHDMSSPVKPEQNLANDPEHDALLKKLDAFLEQS